MNKTVKDKLLNPMLITLARCLMMATSLRLHVCQMDLKFDALMEISLIIIMSFYKNVHSSNIYMYIHTVVVACALYFLGLATHYCES